MNPVKAEEKCQSCTPVYQQTSCNQCFGSSQGGLVKFQSEGTQTQPSTNMNSIQRPQHPLSSFRYYGEMLECPQHYYMLSLTVNFFKEAPFQFSHEGAQNLPSVSMNTKQTLQTPPRTLQYSKEMSDVPQNNGREKIVKGTVSVGKPMAVTGEEAETGPSGDLTACQLLNTSSVLPQGLSGASAHSFKKPREDVLLKRELRLLKNREAARECRRKKKEYVKCLENHVAVLENQNKFLIEELRALKDIYQHKVE